MTGYVRRRGEHLRDLTAAEEAHLERLDHEAAALAAADEALERRWAEADRAGEWVDGNVMDVDPLDRDPMGGDPYWAEGRP